MKKKSKKNKKYRLGRKTKVVTSYFPITIRLSETNKEMIIKTPGMMPRGVPFIVIKTNKDKK